MQEEQCGAQGSSLGRPSCAWSGAAGPAAASECWWGSCASAEGRAVRDRKAQGTERCGGSPGSPVGSPGCPWLWGCAQKGSRRDNRKVRGANKDFITWLLVLQRSNPGQNYPGHSLSLWFAAPCTGAAFSLSPRSSREDTAVLGSPPPSPTWGRGKDTPLQLWGAGLHVPWGWDLPLPGHGQPPGQEGKSGSATPVPGLCRVPVELLPNPCTSLRVCSSSFPGWWGWFLQILYNI